MALTRITKRVIKPNENYDTHDINSTGIITATALDISGNASIGGVLTYEDVTSIDSVGIITAQNGLHVLNGYVGIGTAFPGEALDINSKTNSRAIRVYSEGSSSTSKLVLRTGDSGNSKIHFGDTSDIDTGEIRYRHNGDIMSFYTNGNNERLQINSDGRTLFTRGGLTASRNVGTKTGEIQVANSGNSSAISIISYTNDVGGPHLVFGKSRAGNATGSTIVQSGDRLGEIAFCGADGTDIDSFAAAIKAHVDGTPGANDMPGRLEFYTTGDGGSSAVERVRIDSNGRIIQNYAALPSVSSNLPYAYFAPTKQNYGGVDLTMNLHDDSSNALGNGGGIGFSANSSTGSPIVRGAIRGNVEATNSTAGYLTLHTRDAGGNTTEKVRITSEGYLHLGNTAHGTNKVGGQAITGQDLDAAVKLYSSNSNLWLAQLRGDNTTSNGVFLRSGNSSSNYTLYATGYDENNPHLIVRGDGAVLIGESTQSGMQRGDVVVHASIQSGNVNEPAVIHRDSSGEIIYFEHYFSCTKGGAGNSHTVNQDIIQIQNIGNFHQAVFHCWMGVRLQGQGDSYTRPATWQTGVNRFNGGSSIQFEENWISADSQVQTYANLHVGNANSTSYYVRMNWPSGTYGSSFAGGKIMATFLGCDVANSNITFAYGRT